MCHSVISAAARPGSQSEPAASRGRFSRIQHLRITSDLADASGGSGTRTARVRENRSLVLRQGPAYVPLVGRQQCHASRQTQEAPKLQGQRPGQMDHAHSMNVGGVLAQRAHNTARTACTQRAHAREKLGIFATIGDNVAYIEHTTPPQCWTAFSPHPHPPSLPGPDDATLSSLLPLLPCLILSQPLCFFLITSLGKPTPFHVLWNVFPFAHFQHVSDN